MGPVAMLQPEHQVAAVLVVAQHRSCPIPAASLARAGPAHRILAHRVLKRRAASGAPWRRKKSDPSPAPSAQSIWLADRFTAGKAARRQHPVDPSFGFLAQLSGSRVAADPDLLPFHDGSFDLVASILELHWAGDLPGALVQIRRILKPGGLFLAAMLGGATLVELRTALIEAELVEEGGASPHVSPAAELGDVAGLLLRTGFAMP